MVRRAFMPGFGFIVLAGVALCAQAAPAQGAAGAIERGRYLVKIMGCNDCHTPGYAASGGKVAESLWLTGDSLGWRGPWGTTYPSNLRLYTAGLSQAQWMKNAHTIEYRPPMPWFTLRHMTDADMRAMYAFIKHLGPAGEAAPAHVPPDRTPTGPVVQYPPPPPPK